MKRKVLRFLHKCKPYVRITVCFYVFGKNIAYSTILLSQVYNLFDYFNSIQITTGQMTFVVISMKNEIYCSLSPFAHAQLSRLIKMFVLPYPAACRQSPATSHQPSTVYASHAQSVSMPPRKYHGK